MYNITKLLIRSLENLVMDGVTDGQMDGRTDKSDFIGRCPTNVDRPKDKKTKRFNTFTFATTFLRILILMTKVSFYLLSHPGLM